MQSQTWSLIANVIYYAGETIPIVFYRRDIRHEIMLQLAGRPIPVMPETSEGLAEYLRAGYNEIQRQLTSLFETTTEAQATRRAAPDQWSAHETLAHLVIAERDRQTFIGGLLRGDGDHLDLRANLTPRVEALVERAGSVPKLLTELAEAHAETVAVVARLPTEFATEGESFWMFAHYHVPNMVEHGRVHAAQIRDGIRQMDDTA